MKFIDKNLTLDAPEGYEVDDVRAGGAYLIVDYKREDSAVTHEGGWVDYDRIIVFLNDQGREVGRQIVTAGPDPILPEAAKPVKRRFRIKNGFLLILEGLEEILKCLRGR
jgi:hypothetical protein